MRKLLPSNSKNIFLGSKELKAMDANENQSFELEIPGLIDPNDIVATLHVEADGSRCIIITGRAYDEKHQCTTDGKVSTFKVVNFEEHVRVPVGAENPMPKALLRVAKDSCGHITEGYLTLEWVVTQTNVPIEVQEC